MKQIGADEWNRLSERDRQRHLVRIRVEERRLRQEGRVDEVAVMLEQHLHNQQGTNQLMWPQNNTTSKVQLNLCDLRITQPARYN